MSFLWESLNYKTDGANVQDSFVVRSLDFQAAKAKRSLGKKYQFSQSYKSQSIIGASAIAEADPGTIGVSPGNPSAARGTASLAKPQPVWKTRFCTARRQRT